MATIAENGVIEHRNQAGELDCADGPARLFPSRRIWFVDGVKVSEEG